MSISQQRPCQSTDGLGSQQEGAAASVTAGTGAAWRKVADGQQFGPGELSYYASWIDRDLSRWSETGITQQMVEHAHALARLCNTGAMRLQIINSTLWVAHAGPPSTGYYPASGGPGALSAAGRVPYFLLSLMEALALFPGQVPDVDLVFQPGGCSIFVAACCVATSCKYLPACAAPLPLPSPHRSRSALGGRACAAPAVARSPGPGPTAVSAQHAQHGMRGHRSRQAHQAAVPPAGDFPCIRVGGQAHNGQAPKQPWTQAGLTPRQLQAMAAPPILGYNGHRDFVDIPWPDYNFWGHEVARLVDEQGRWLYGWDAQLARYLNATASLSLAQRWPELLWRGRASTHPRDAVRVRFVGCPAYLWERNRMAAINLKDNHGLPTLQRLDFCRWRFISYMESMAWSTSFKHKLACGSVVMLPVMEYFEFYSRALQPGVHYIELSHQPGEMCDDVDRNVDAMNAWLDAWQARQAAQGALRTNGSAPAAQQRQQRQQQQDEPMQAVSPTVSMSAAAGLSRAPAPGRRKPQARSGSAHQPQGGGRLLAASASPFPPKARVRYSNAYDSDLTPLEVARSAQQFMRDHVRMRDVRLYIRDLLIAYAAMQRFKPRVQPGAVQYTGAKLLQECQHPHKADAFHIAARYPWLPEWQ